MMLCLNSYYVLYPIYLQLEHFVCGSAIGITSLKNNFVIVGAKNFGRLFETTAIPEIREQAQ